jgi:hypothetical protein
MKTILVSTIPRSGTWAVRHFFRFLGHYAPHGPGAQPRYQDAVSPFVAAVVKARMRLFDIADVAWRQADDALLPGGTVT